MTNLNVALQSLQALGEDWQEPLHRACERMAPVWPLDQWIAVNPFWGMRHLPVGHADRVLGQRGGFAVLMPADFYREAWEGGRIRREDLTASLRELDEEESSQHYLDLLYGTHRPVTGLPLSVLDVYASGPDGSRVADAVRDQVAGTCATFFDRSQAQWLSSPEADNLFHYWLETTRQDRALDGRTGIAGARKAMLSLPGEPADVLAEAVRSVNMTPEELECLGHALLLRINGWASWCRGVDWRKALEGLTSDRCGELLSVMLVWEMIGLRCTDASGRARWQQFRTRTRQAPADTRPDPLWVWQRAYEIAYQRRLWRVLAEPGSASEEPESVPDVQAVFCIDVRSEVIRRHLEAVHPSVQTLGFAGFFGLPVTHQPHGPVSSLRRLPGLLPASYQLVDTLGSYGKDAAENRRLDQKEVARASVRKAKYGSLSSFTLVETTGLAWAWKLLRDTLRQGTSPGSAGEPERRLVHRVGGDPVTDREKAGLLASMLRGMSLTSHFAPLVVFVGHGSHTENNPNAAGLNCGACGGQSGGINAMLAAKLFNDPHVRAFLAEEGIRVPDYVRAIAAEHCTVTDEVTIAGVEQVPDTHLQRLMDLRKGFEAAASRARAERAAPLGLNGLDDAGLKAAMGTRTRDWSEVRPEWGLANNAAIVFAKRSRTRGKDLSGRVFLHDYDPDQDHDGRLLESLLSAPMIVANWINMQYFASVTVPEIYGAGNKLLHSVVGGNIGVVEGVGADLRIGLPLQSVHDGTVWRHEPVRLSAVVDAPADRIDAVIGRQADVAALVENQWVLLYRYANNGFERYDAGRWRAVTESWQRLSRSANEPGGTLEVRMGD